MCTEFRKKHVHIASTHLMCHPVGWIMHVTVKLIELSDSYSDVTTSLKAAVIDISRHWH